ncbi:MAG TPA: FAD-dependent oxidoreductase [Gemmatimonadaceae bacterium]|nr:FAD-dependent oxidoreductase [Gemmatimonadaceae bacterium]
MPADAIRANVPVWEDAAWEGLPVLEQELVADVCVVGLGGSGLAAVHELLTAGARVVGVDAGSVAGGAAGRNGGFLIAGLSEFHHDAVARFGRERATALYRLTMDEIERIAAETPQAVRLTGSLRIAASDEEERDCRAQLDAMHADALPAEWYEAREGRGLLIPTDGVYHPMHRCRTLAREAIAGGARLFERSAATHIAGTEVLTTAGRVRCGAVVACVDGALARTFPELASRVRSARLQMLATAPTDAVHLTRPVYTRWGYDYWQQLADRRLVFGGFRDEAEQEEWTDVAEPTTRVQELQERFVREQLGVREPVTHRWAATVSFSSSGLPIFEEVRTGVWAAGAYSGTGNVIGALCGRAAAQLATGQSAVISELLRSEQSFS